MDAFEGDFSFCVVGVSTIVIGSFDYGWGLPVFIRMLLLALKYMEGSLFHFPFCSGDVLRVARTAATSLARISGDFSFCCPVFRLPVESPVLTIFWLPVETVSMFPVEIVSTVLVCLARFGSSSFFSLFFCLLCLY